MFFKIKLFIRMLKNKAQIAPWRDYESERYKPLGLCRQSAIEGKVNRRRGPKPAPPPHSHRTRGYLCSFPITWILLSREKDYTPYLGYWLPLAITKTSPIFRCCAKFSTCKMYDYWAICACVKYFDVKYFARDRVRVRVKVRVRVRVIN